MYLNAEIIILEIIRSFIITTIDNIFFMKIIIINIWQINPQCWGEISLFNADVK